MKIFIVSPNINSFFSSQQIDSLNKVGEVIFQKNTCSFEEIPDLFKGTTDRILAIDPDFCDWKLPNEMVGRIPHLKAIVLQTTSFSWVDVDFAKSRNIPVVNLRGFSSIAVSEWATMMMLNLARKLPVIVKDHWRQDYTRHKGIELRGKTAGIIGLGNIGTAIAENCKGIGMNVQYWSKNSHNDHFKSVNLETLMKTSDVIFPVVAQNSETKGLISDEMLKSMKKTVIFVSVIHNVYNHELLLELAKKGDIFGYGFEDPKARLENFDGNVWAGPELAWCTEDSMRKNTQQWIEAITNASKGKYPTKVN